MRALILHGIFFYIGNLSAQDLSVDLALMSEQLNQLDQYTIEMEIVQSSSFIAEKKSTIEY